MTEQSPVFQKYSKIDKLIASSRFNEAFLLLKRELKSYPQMIKTLEKLKGVESNYKYMLDYILEGNSDPSQENMINQIKEDLFFTNDLFLRESLLKDSGDIYSSTRRIFSLRNMNMLSLFKEYIELSQQKLNNIEGNKIVISENEATIIENIFCYIWTLQGEADNDYDTVGEMFESEIISETVKALMVSAITLGNLAYFNPRPFEMLINLFESSESDNIKARAITAIILISLIHSGRIAGNLKLRSRLLLISEDPTFRELIEGVLLNLLRTFDTNRVDNKMRNEVIPGLMKIKPEIIDKMRNMASDSENFLSDGNPDWEDIFEKSDVGDKLKEITDMQLEGADVMVTAFSQLKRFPFFNKVSNWFLPFEPGYYEFQNLNLEFDSSTIPHLTSFMCDSDAHSFILSLGSMPEQQRNYSVSNMKAQLKDAFEAIEGGIGETEKVKMNRLIRHSLQDLYRFFKFFRKKDDFKDPFAVPFVSSQIEPLMHILAINPEEIRIMAEFYFKNKYYKEAIGFFELYDKLKNGDFKVWEKIAYCYDRINEFPKAVEWYRKAELVSPDNPWLIKKLAIALKNSGEINQAEEFYKKALQNEPENYHLLMSAGQACLEGKHYEEALKYFYHANYLKPEKASALRAAAWTELLAGNLKKASELYEKLITGNKSDRTDFLNAAHCYLALGDFKKALINYKNFAIYSGNTDVTSLVLAFKEDSETLRQIGIKTSDLRLIVDKIRYDLYQE